MFFSLFASALAHIRVFLSASALADLNIG